jgi:F420-non-reducing hydrogenase iron-sulfur subunit
MAEFEPKILAFCCNWCSYAGADLAGVSRFQYPPNIRIIRTMCSGRVEPEFVVKALSLGVDGVLVLGCHIGDCHYIYGNHRTKKRMAILRKILEYLGINPARARLEWVSASEGARFAEVVSEFTGEMKKLGPNPLKLEALKGRQNFVGQSEVKE